MSNRTLRIFILIGALAILAIIGIQLHLLRTAFSDQQSKFSQSVQIGLLDVIHKMYGHDPENMQDYSPVKQVSNNYFIVDVNDHIDANLLEAYLITEFKDLGISEDFEYAIYDCETDNMVYGSYIHMSEKEKALQPASALPTYPNLVYYFGVHFPGQRNYILSSLRIWIILASVSFLILFFFVYAIITVLRQRKLSELQRNFVNNMTHEFKTPLTATRLALDSLIACPEVQSGKRSKQYCDIIQQQNNRLNTQVERILQLALSDKVKPGLHLQTIDLQQVIVQTAQTFTQDQDRINYSDKPKPCIPIRADHLHLNGMLFNLIDNALKYSEDSVRISCITEGNRVKLSVSDSGLGIAQKEQKKIFRKFHRVATGDVHNVKGFGLGLYYVKQVCRWHGWQVHVKSALGEGAEFTVGIPIKKSNDRS